MPKKPSDSGEQPEIRDTGGDVNLGRQTTHTGHVIHGDVSGDIVGGNKSTTQTAGGDIVGRDKITHSGDAAALERLSQEFALIRRAIEARPPDPNVEREEIKETVGRIEAEAKKGEQANTSKLERWLMTLGAMADDIFQVTVATLSNPALGVAKAIQLIAQKAKAEKEKLDALQAPGDA